MTRHIVRPWRIAAALALLPCLALAQTAPPPTPAAPPAVDLGSDVGLPQVDVIGATPLLGSGVARDKVPASTNVLTGQDVVRTGIPSLTDALNASIPGLNIVDESGNPFQPSVLFRGFNASPIEGDTQGLAVYVNGTRFNEPFG
jgi:outer membrane receptor for Fe3+-dicitrate